MTYRPLSTREGVSLLQCADPRSNAFLVFLQYLLCLREPIKAPYLDCDLWFISHAFYDGEVPLLCQFHES